MQAGPSQDPNAAKITQEITTFHFITNWSFPSLPLNMNDNSPSEQLMNSSTTL